jgi:thiamine-monophosphate kinase
VDSGPQERYPLDIPQSRASRENLPMESELIAHLRRRLPSHPRLRLGPGDDAAVLRMAELDDCVLTVDLLTDHVDFELAKVDPKRVGRKALAVNLSDLAAMASRPLAGVVALALPRQGGMDLAVQLYEGLLPLAEQYDVAIAGGDTNSWEGPLVISVTLLGEVTGNGPLTRGGAAPGDRIVVTGSFGGSILGRQFDFEPRVHEALLLNQRYELHAGIDVSDGLSIDLGHVAAESGCGAVLQTGAVPVAEDARRLAEKLGDGSTPRGAPDGDRPVCRRAGPLADGRPRPAEQAGRPRLAARFPLTVRPRGRQAESS